MKEYTMKELFAEVGLSEPDWDSFFSRRKAAIARHYFNRKTDSQGRIALVSHLLGQAVKDPSAIRWSTSECPSGACGPLFVHIGGQRIALVQ